MNEEERQALLDQSLASARGAGGHLARSLVVQENEGKRAEYASKDPFQVNNKHERLFCCGRRGVNYLIVNTSQFMYLLTILFFAMKACTVVPDVQDSMEDQTKLIIIGVILFFTLIILSYTWFGIVPGILTSYTITANIEMMKDREMIYKVIKNQRMERTKRSFRIYQVFKLIRREMIIEFRK